MHGSSNGNDACVLASIERPCSSALDLVLEQRPEVLVLHSGPSGDRAQRGVAEIRERLLEAPPLLVICGHTDWDYPLYDLANGSQILNVHARAVLTCR